MSTSEKDRSVFECTHIHGNALAARSRPARERILETAYDLFARRGVRDGAQKLAALLIDQHR
jgi:hypothetical protein